MVSCKDPRSSCSNHDMAACSFLTAPIFRCTVARIYNDTKYGAGILYLVLRHGTQFGTTTKKNEATSRAKLEGILIGVICLRCCCAAFCCWPAARFSAVIYCCTLLLLLLYCVCCCYIACALLCTPHSLCSFPAKDVLCGVAALLHSVSTVRFQKKN